MSSRTLICVCGLAALAAPVRADEGLWLFESFPKALLQKRHGVRASDGFLRHLQMSAVRFNSGGTGSFVSSSGLLFTNHHVGADCIQKLSGPGRDYLNQGFLAASQSEERPCPDLEVNVLLKSADVTTRVNAGVEPRTPAAEANQKRKAAMSAIEKECSAASDNRCDVVTLFSGGRYHLYEYKKYTDIRLVFAPEFGIAFFGGDPDNFTYPRYCLDIAFFRAYENGQPAKVEHFFGWSKEGAKDGDLIFTSGNPGTTGRLATVAQLEFSRDASYPLIHRRLSSLIAALEEYRRKGPEEHLAAQENLFSQTNSQKAYTGFLGGLNEKALMDRKRADEKLLRANLARDPKKREEFGRVWDDLATAYAEYRKFYRQYFLLEAYADLGSPLLKIAREVIRYGVETAKPGGERLREYSQAGLPSLEAEMFSEAPLTASMEIAVLTNLFQFLDTELGAGDETVRSILGGKSASAAARGYVESSKLASVAERKRLAKDQAAARASDDGMIRLAWILDAPARRYRKLFEDKVEGVVAASASQVALARFALSGGNDYPDATFTLRVSFGKIKGYTSADGKPYGWATSIAGLYERATGSDPYVLPPAWLKHKARLAPLTPFNFVATADIHGGNSGSATVNAKGELVGIVFDSNLEALPNRFVYTDARARSIHVASQGIVEALRNIYGAQRVLSELGF
jgi:hypothetical protein